jgi:hypothetical protein
MFLLLGKQYSDDKLRFFKFSMFSMIFRFWKSLANFSRILQDVLEFGKMWKSLGEYERVRESLVEPVPSRHDLIGPGGLGFCSML